jgi:rhamnulokinase
MDGEHLAIDEAHRFPNRPLHLPDRLAWDISGLFQSLLEGIRAVGAAASIGIDSWAIDFGLLRADGSLCAPPRCYRDPHTAGILPTLFARLSREKVFQATGIQMMELNTSCQLLALSRRDAPELKEASRLVLIPDLLLHWLGADPAAERTNASTTQLLSPHGDWSDAMLAACGISRELLPPLVEPGQPAGRMDGRLGVPEMKLVHVASHDTASAVAGTPLSARSVYISSGTWSLVGVECERPVLSAQALSYNLTNEEGYDRTTRLLRNVMGLWLAQRCRDVWGIENEDIPHFAAAGRPFAGVVDPDDSSFLRADDMPTAITAYLRSHHQRAPEDRGTLLRVILESLALRYRWVVDALAETTKSKPTAIHIVGGGCRNGLLCQLTADACRLPVLAGPAEATALGNIAVQMIASGELSGIGEARDLIRRSFPPIVYEPRSDARIEEAYGTFLRLVD